MHAHMRTQMRLMCCSGINVTPRNGTTAAMHLLRMERAAAQAASARPMPVLWHSEMSPLGRASVRLIPLRPVAAEDDGGVGVGATLLGEMEALHALHAARWAGEVGRK
jgi:hypothetical protein